jgi:hypothetical protein
MSEKYATAVHAPEISKDGKAIRLVLCDPDGNALLPLIVSTQGAARIAEMLSRIVKTAEITHSINTAESVQGFKPTPLMYQVKGLDIVYHPPTKETTLAMLTSESVELYLKFQPDMFHVLAELARQFDGLQVPENDTVN